MIGKPGLRAIVPRHDQARFLEQYGATPPRLAGTPVCQRLWSDEETASLSKAQFIKRADQICKEGGERSERGFIAIAKRMGSGASKSERRALARELVEESFGPNLERQIEEIRSLGIPSGDEDQVESVLVAMQKVIDSSEKEPLQFVLAKAGSLKPFEEATSKAEAYGFTYCPR